MKFSEVLIGAIRESEIPLRFEPGAEEAVADVVTEMLKDWVAAHKPDAAEGDFEFGRNALVARLLDELDGKSDLPAGNPGVGKRGAE